LHKYVIYNWFLNIELKKSIQLIAKFMPKIGTDILAFFNPEDESTLKLS